MKISPLYVYMTTIYSTLITDTPTPVSPFQFSSLQHLVMKLTLVAPNKQELRKLLQGYLSQVQTTSLLVFIMKVR